MGKHQNKKLAETNKNIPVSLYKKIHSLMPISCVDILLVQNGKFLLTLRKNKPAKGEWWLPGGRILKNERLIDAVKRKLKEETGIITNNIRILDTDETFFFDGPFNSSTHTINIIYIVEMTKKQPVVLDKQASDFKWASKIEKSWHPYIRNSLKKAGFK